MQRKFQYIMIGSGLTILVILGVFALIFSQARADTTNEIAVNSNDVLSETAVQTTNSSQTTQVVTDSNHQTYSSDEEQNEVVSLLDANQTTVMDIEVEDSVPSLETMDGPETDPSIIVAMVEELARQQEDTLLNSSGWLHIVSQPYTPEDQLGSQELHSAATGEMIPREELVPDSARFESWYHVDERGIFNEAMSLVTTVEGIVSQQSILIGDQWLNLTLQARGFVPEQSIMRNVSNEATLPVSHVASLLDEALVQENIEMQAYLNNEQYVVVVEEIYSAPIYDSISQAVVLGSKTTHSIDAQTGQLSSTEMQLLFENSGWVLRERWDYPITELLAELPEEIARLYADGVNAAVGEE